MNRRKRRSAWLASKTQPRVGTETLYGDDILVTRTKRVPPTWLLEKYVEGGDKVHMLLVKSDKGTRKAFRWALMGKDYITLHSSRRAALRTFEGLEPVLDEKVVDNGHVVL